HLDIGSDGVSDFDFSTIQGAVNAASGEDTVRVDAGTYPELVVVTKSITLLGAQAGVPGCGRSSSFESVVGTPNGAFQILADNVAGGVVTWFASDLTISGNTWRDSLGTSVFLGGDVSHVLITGNTFDSADFRGIRILAGAIGADTTRDTNVVVNFNSFLDNTL